MFSFSTFARRAALVSATRTVGRPRFALLSKTGFIQPKQRNLLKATTTTTPLFPSHKWMGQGAVVRLLCKGVPLVVGLAAGCGWIGYQKIKPLSQEQIVFSISRDPQVRIDAVVAKIVAAATVLMREQQQGDNNNNRALVVQSERLDTKESNSDDKKTVQSYYYPGAVGRLLGDQQHLPDHHNHHNNNLTWQVHVIPNPIPNAFVSPQGAPRQMFITTGMLNLADTPDELALIMGHELAHVLCNHGRYHAVEEMVMLVGAVWCFKTPSLFTTATLLLSSQLYDLLVVKRRSRQHEVEADMLGLKLTAMAGFDTTAGTEIFRKLAMYTSENEFLGGSTHPPSLTRYHYLKEGAKQENRETYGTTGLHHDADLVVTRLFNAICTVHKNQSWGGRIRVKNVDEKSNEVNSSNNDDDDDDDGVYLL